LVKKSIENNYQALDFFNINDLLINDNWIGFLKNIDYLTITELNPDNELKKIKKMSKWVNVGHNGSNLNSYGSNSYQLINNY
jgi:hypothetical protein